ncbi:Protein transport protein sec24 [Neolecta irregularis DAH-3]|uniref:Protein transport protein sec24 n=1 Tax=Neolecta irregularis (strain DAH-3) TaxID=1198029 RepID=A0A1U7LNV2_NEOID|nr:Protein transport protein sec24 [Neolecta irregularis DAH-3]|eukprot:OLL24308.1 Protein transport protein sec24 [Neolecta irregularis DAH-3]
MSSHQYGQHQGFPQQNGPQYGQDPQGQQYPQQQPQSGRHPQQGYPLHQEGVNQQVGPPPSNINAGPPDQQPQSAGHLSTVPSHLEYSSHPQSGHPASAQGRSRRAYPSQQYETPPTQNYGPVMDSQAGQFGQQGVTDASQIFTPAAPLLSPAGFPSSGGYGGQAAGYGPHNPPQSVAQVTDQFQQMGLVQGLNLTNPLIPIDLHTTRPQLEDLEAPPPPLQIPADASLTHSETANCPPEFMRCTLNAIPKDHGLLKKSKLPLALVVRPYITLREEEAPVPVVGDSVISRCRRCRAYINPYAIFIEGNTRWRCNFCGLSNEVPAGFDYDMMTNHGLDRWKREEINHAVVDFIAPKEYMVRAPPPLVYVFLIDVSYNAVTSGLVATAARTILESLDRIPDNDRRTRISIVGVDSNLCFFSLHKDRAEPEMLIVSDLEDVQLPRPDDLLVGLHECRAGIENLLTHFNEMFQHTQNGSNCMGSALEAAHKMIGNLGGKAVCLTATLPNVGTGKLVPRDESKLLGTPKASSLLQAQNSFYRSFPLECSKNQMSVDMWLFSSQYQDVASLSCLPRYTGGQTFHYPSWNASREEDAFKFAHEFSNYLSMEIQLEAVMRVRGAVGLRMSAFYGNFFNRSSDLCAFPSFPRDQSYVVEVSIDEDLKSPFVCIQTAVLHSTCHGERRIRVLTMAIPTAKTLNEVYASADQVAIAAYMTHRAVERALASKLEEARESIVKTIAGICETYKKNISGGISLQLPNNLKLLPLLALGLYKHIGLRDAAVPSDMRAAALCLLSTLPAPALMNYILPRFYSLHDMPDESGRPGPNGIVMPPRMNLSTERFERFGLYLIDDGQSQFLWVGREAVPQLIMDVFDLSSINELQSKKGKLPVLENEFSERINGVIAKSREYVSGLLYYPNLYIIREDGEPSLRQWVLSHLIEDRTDRGYSYIQFLNLLKEKVNA